MKKYNYKHNTLVKVLLYVSSIMAIVAFVLKTLSILDILITTSYKTSDIIIASVELLLAVVLLWTLFGSKVVLDNDAMYVYVAFTCKQIHYNSIVDIIKETHSDTLYMIIEVSGKRSGTIVPIYCKCYDDFMSTIREYNPRITYTEVNNQGK